MQQLLEQLGVRKKVTGKSHRKKSQGKTLELKNIIFIHLVDQIYIYGGCM